jgi:hypothetical protein
MDKIAIIGPSGAGKSTLAQKLGPRLRLKVYHLDRFFWQPTWRKESRETRIAVLESFIQKNHWIIEGTYLNSSELHLQEADTIIFLDIPPFVCLWRRIKRHHEYKGCPRRDIPKGSSDKLTLPGILKILFFPLGAKRKLEDKLRNFPEKAIRLHSTEEVERFLSQPEIYTNEMRQSSSSVVTIPILAFVIIAIFTKSEWAFAMSLILTALGFVSTVWQIGYFSLSKKEHQMPMHISKNLWYFLLLITKSFNKII